MTKPVSPSPVPPPVMLQSDAALLAESLLLSVPTREVVAEPATRVFFTVPAEARAYPIMGRTVIADTNPVLRPGVTAYNVAARDRNIPAARIKAANRWSGPMLSALRLMADRDADAGARAVALGLLSPADTN